MSALNVFVQRRGETRLTLRNRRFMSIRAKVVSIIAAASLVAGAGLAVAAPAQANTKAKGNTVITLDKKVAGALKKAGVTIRVTKPGSAKGAKLTFPVTGVGTGTITHSGELQFVKGGQVAVAVSNPEVKVNADNPTTAGIYVTHPLLGQILLFEVVNLKAKGPSTKGKNVTIVYTGRLNLTKDEFIVNAVNGLLGAPLLTPGMRMGSVKSTVITKK